MKATTKTRKRQRRGMPERLEVSMSMGEMSWMRTVELTGEGTLSDVLEVMKTSDEFRDPFVEGGTLWGLNAKRKRAVALGHFDRSMEDYFLPDSPIDGIEAVYADGTFDEIPIG